MALPVGPKSVQPLSLPNVASPKSITAPGEATGAEGSTGVSFADNLNEAVKKVDAAQKTAQQAATDFAEGRSNDLHNTMVAAQQAEISLRLLATARNRFVDMYREVMRMSS